MDFQALIREHILNLKPYSSARDEYSGSSGVFLDANENPLGSVAGGNYNRYPDPHQKNIKERLSVLKGISADHIFLGNGSDEAIDLLIQATCIPNKSEMVIMPPTYGMYQVCADIHQTKVVEADLTPRFEIDLEAVQMAVSSLTKLVWVCSPNNPSGNLLSREQIIYLLTSYPNVLFVIDEAYIDFADTESFIGLINRFENLAVLQTFSKAWGLAGLRVGTAYASPKLIDVLNKIKYPYNLNSATQSHVLAALNNLEEKNNMVERIKKNREKLKKDLNQLKSVEHIYHSDSNQLLVRFRHAKKLFNSLLEEKVILRDRTKVKLCNDCLRISIGSEEENDLLVSSIKKLSIEKV